LSVSALLDQLIIGMSARLVMQWVHVGGGRREASGWEEEEEATEEGQAQG